MSEGYDWGRAEAEVADVPQPGLPSARPEPSLTTVGAPSLFEVARPELTFDDVIDLEPLQDRLSDLFLQPFRRSEPANRTFSARVLLYGPPGCGKTTLARAIAGELGVPLLRANGAQLADLYAGESEQALRELFDVARVNAPCVIFFDELDTIDSEPSRARAPWLQGGIRQLLTELGSVARAGHQVAVVGAATRPWAVDSLLRREGGFQTALFVRPPGASARREYLERALDDRVDLDELARLSEGSSGADILQVCATAGPRATTQEVAQALAAAGPTVASWLEEARAAADGLTDDGLLDDLRSYLESA